MGRHLTEIQTLRVEKCIGGPLVPKRGRQIRRSSRITQHIRQRLSYVLSRRIGLLSAGRPYSSMGQAERKRLLELWFVLCLNGMWDQGRVVTRTQLRSHNGI